MPSRIRTALLLGVLTLGVSMVCSLEPAGAQEAATLEPAAADGSSHLADARVNALRAQSWDGEAIGPPSGSTSPIAGVRALARSPSGILWLATSDGVLRLDGHRVTRFEPPGESALATAYDVDFDGSGTLVVATGAGAYRFDGRRFVVLSRPGTGGRPWPARLLYRDRDGVLWLAAPDSLLRLQPDAFTLRQGLPGVAVHLLWEDPWGYLWAAAESGQVFRRLGSAFQPVNFPLGMGEARIRCFHVDETGYMWLVRSDHTWRVEGDFERAGLPRSAAPIAALDGLDVTSCARDDRGGLWMAAGGSLLYRAPDASMAEIDVGVGPIRDLLARNDGGLWVGGEQGLVHLVDPSTEPHMPEVLLAEVWIDDEEVEIGSVIEMPSGAESLRLGLATPSFRRIADVRTRYAWGEASDDGLQWLELGGSELVLDPPLGRSALTLQAGRGDRWNAPGTTLWIEREPAIWQTRAFWGAIGAGVAAIVVWLLYLRWAGPGHAPLEPPDEADDDIVHLEDLDTDELTVSRETVERAKRNIFGERPDDG